MTTSQLVPAEILSAFFADGVDDISPIGAGIINATLLVTTKNGERVVLQRLAPIFNEDTVRDYAAISRHMQDEGWEVPALRETVHGTLFAIDDGANIWRVFEYVDSDAASMVDAATVTTPLVYGELLGRLHASLARFPYQPLFALPNFHDTAYYANTLAEVMQDLPSDEGRDVARDILAVYETLPALPEVEKHVIHGDPRKANILHRAGKPFTFIDWDTLMHGTIWMDIGDMLRSLSEDALKRGEPVPVEILEEVAEGYRRAAQPDAEPKEFRMHALRAAQMIAVELAMRFAADYKDGDEGYFRWDQEKFASRHEYTLRRARMQMEIASQLQQRIDMIRATV